MGAKARGFLLFSFAFSSVFSSGEILAPEEDFRETEGILDADASVEQASRLLSRKGTEKRDAGHGPDGSEFEKRAPTGFAGMRGKKESEWEKRVPLGFAGMRGKKEYGYPENESDSQDFFVNSGLFDADELRDGEFFDEGILDKRSPWSFHGLRGRKGDDYGFKRAMGFLGMRGKKSPEAWRWDEFDKRAPQTAFFGMRGEYRHE